MEELATFEPSKENILPLRGGRKPSLLALSLRDGDDSSVHHDTMADFEKRVENCDEEDDPLEPWIEYVQWTKQTFSDEVSRDQKLLPLLERAIDRFHQVEMVRNDVRFVQICLDYADFWEDPTIWFSFLASRKIGESIASFYIAYAVILEDRNCFQAADKVFQKGLEKMAHPIKKLRNAASEFEARLATTKNSGSDRIDVDVFGTRRPFTTIPKAKRGERTSRVVFQKASTGPTRTGFSLKQRVQEKKRSKTQSSFQVFSDFEEETPASSSFAPSISASTVDDIPAIQRAETGLRGAAVPKRSEISKENVDKPTQWTDFRVRQSRGVGIARSSSRAKPSSGSGFTIFTDEHLRAEKPSGATKDKRTSKRQSSATASSSKQIAKGYLLDVKDGEEMSFEEMRALHYWEQHASDDIQEEFAMLDDMMEREDADTDFLHKGTHDHDFKDDDDDDDDDEEEFGIFNLDDGKDDDLPAKRHFAQRIPDQHPSLCEVSVIETGPAPSPTICTKSAMKSVMEMFTSPANEGPEEEEEEINVSFKKHLDFDGSIGEVDLASPTVAPRSAKESSFTSAGRGGFGGFSGFGGASSAGASFVVFEEDGLEASKFTTPSTRRGIPAGGPSSSTPFQSLPIPDSKTKGKTKKMMMKKMTNGDVLRKEFNIESSKKIPKRREIGTKMPGLFKGVVQRYLREHRDELELRVRAMHDIEEGHDVPDISKLQRMKRRSVLVIGDHEHEIESKLHAFEDGLVLLDSKQHVIKLQQPVTAWEFHVLKELSKETSAPRQALVVPRPVTFIAGSKVGALVMTQVGIYSLQDVVNAYRMVGSRMDETLAMFYAYQLLKALHELHSAKIIHGDVKPDNIMVRHGEGEMEWRKWTPRRTAEWEDFGIALVDFEHSIDLNLYEEKKFVGRAPGGESFECEKQRIGKEWNFEGDAFAAASVLHVLLHGEYMEASQASNGRWIPTKPFRRYWAVELWTSIFSELMNADESLSLRLKGLCQTLETALSSDEKRSSAVFTHLQRQHDLVCDYLAEQKEMQK